MTEKEPIIEENMVSLWESMTEEEKKLNNRITQILWGSNDDIDKSNLVRIPQKNSVREITPIKHIHQSDSWDCGLTCIQMVLHWMQQNRSEYSRVSNDKLHGMADLEASTSSLHPEILWMMNFVNTESIWTIDLVMILDHILHGDRDNVGEGLEENFLKDCHEQISHPQLISEACYPFQNPILDQTKDSAVSYLFCSKNLGVDESYHRFGYYNDAFSSDMTRVERLFKLARQRSLPMIQVTCLSVKVLADIVSRKGCVAIVLMDNRVLLQDSKCKSKSMGNEIRNPVCMDNAKTSVTSHTNNRATTKCFVREKSYTGHYVLLCGISHDVNNVEYARSFCSEESRDDETFCMVVKNPGSWKALEFISPKRFEEAWRSDGTDEDIIIININDVDL